MDHERDFYGWLRQARRGADLTQEALAEAVGCAAQTLRAFESGRRRPSREMAARIADVLQIAPAEREAFIQLARTPPATPEPRAEEAPPGPSPAAPPAASAIRPLVLATKLHRPQSDLDLVRRPQLFARLDVGLGRPLTVVTAPAGFGKTTLVSTWLASRSQTPGQTARCAWLTLDAGDGDPVSFLRYLIAALQTLTPGLGATTLALLDSPQIAPPTVLLPLLVSELAALPERSVLVLDDYHTIASQSVHEALGFLLDHLPAQLHLVIASRTDPPLPLARLRARRQLVELRAADLRFTPEEAAAFLTDVMGLPLSADDIATLEARTEGWVAGLQLAALSLQERPEDQRSPFIAAFAGSHRFVVDYLVDEVLSAQPAHVQRFLLATSILDRLCGPLCDTLLDLAHDARAVEGGAREQPSAGSYGQRMLEYLERSNLFILPLDEQRRWYRYHHLFAQVLNQRLLASVDLEAAALHRCAADWFARQGLVEEAVGQALAARDWTWATDLIVAHGRGLMVRGHIHTVRGWLAALPAGLASEHPPLQLLHATALLFENQHAAAEHHLQAAEASLASSQSDPQARSTLGHTALLRATLAMFRGDLARRDALTAQALELLPPAEASVRAVAQIHAALACERSGDARPAQERRLGEAVAAARAADELGNLLFALVSLAAFQQRQGRLRLAAATYAEAAAIVHEPLGLQLMTSGASYAFGLGCLYYEWDDLEQAEALLLRGQEIVRGQLVAEAAAVVRGYHALARLRLARGDEPGALATLDELQEVARQRQFAPRLRARAAAARAQLALMRGELSEAKAWGAGVGARPEGDPPYLWEPELLTLARVQLASGRGAPAGRELREALASLGRLLVAAEAAGRADSAIEILLLQALARRAQGLVAEAVADLERALRLAGSEGYVRRFVDEGPPMAALLGEARARGVQLPAIAALLAAFPDRHEPLAQGTGAAVDEPLTGREREVLRLLAAGNSNQAIADALVVAVGTVKRHINSIFGKLQVQSRLQAVARARELELL